MHPILVNKANRQGFDRPDDTDWVYFYGYKDWEYTISVEDTEGWEYFIKVSLLDTDRELLEMPSSQNPFYNTIYKPDGTEYWECPNNGYYLLKIENATDPHEGPFEYRLSVTSKNLPSQGPFIIGRILDSDNKGINGTDVYIGDNMCTTGSIDSVMNANINAIDADGWYFIPVPSYDPDSAGYKISVTTHGDPNNILAHTDLIISKENGVYLANDIIIAGITSPGTDKDVAGDFERAYAFWQDKLDGMYPLQDDTDKDHTTNQYEFLMGTDPSDPNDYQCVTISGYVKGTDGLPIPSAIIQASSSLYPTASISTCTTDPNGYYAITLPYGWSGTIRAEQYTTDGTCYIFTPEGISYTDIIIATGDQDYTGEGDNDCDSIGDGIDPDDDNDSLPDAWEIRYGLDPFIAQDVHGGGGDFDNDTWTNYEEYLDNTNPSDPNSIPPITPPILNNPADGGVVTLKESESVPFAYKTPTLSVYNSPEGEKRALSYLFELYQDKGLSDRIVSEILSQGNIITSWTVPEDLPDMSAYYWRVRAEFNQHTSGWMSAGFSLDTNGQIPNVTVMASKGVFVNGGTQEIIVTDGNSPIKGACVVIDSGALLRDCNITIGVVTNPPALPPDTLAIGRVIDFGPSGMEFSKGVYIVIPYYRESLERAKIDDPNELEVFGYDVSALKWGILGGYPVADNGGAIKLEVDHFSIFTLGKPLADDKKVADNLDGGVCFIGCLGL